MRTKSGELRSGFLVLVLALGCAPRGESAAARPATIDVRPVPNGSALVAEPPPPACAIEGAGEPEDRLMFHPVEDLLVFGARADVEPLVRIEGRGRYTLRGRWTELSAEEGDGRARLALESPGSYRIAGFSLLHATRFRLRRRSAVVAEHVWLEPDFVVRVAGAAGARAQVVAAVPFDAPKELTLEVGCSDLAYDDRRERVRDPAQDDARAHIDRIALYDAPGGSLVFEGGPQLFFVIVDEERAGFARIHGERHGIRIAGWTPAALVSRDPQGTGTPGGSRSFRATASKGKAARVTRTAPLLADRAGRRVVIGEVEPGTRVSVLQSGTERMVTVELAAPEVRAVPGVVLLLAESDVEAL